MLYIPRAGIVSPGAAAAPAPTLNGSESYIGIDSGVQSHTISLAGQTHTAGDYLLFTVGLNVSAAISSVAGDTDDTYALIDNLVHTDGGPHLALYEGTLAGSLDANVDVSLANSSRFAGGLLTISGAAGNASQPNASAFDDNAGTFDQTPICPSITTTVDNCLVFAIVNARGAHNAADIEAAVPPGWTFAVSKNTNGEVNDFSALTDNTNFVAWKVQASQGATGDATWTNALGADQRWVAAQIAIAPA